MNLVLLFDEDFVAPDTVRIAGRRAAHVIGVHGAGVGAVLRVGRLHGRIGHGTVSALGDGRLEMTVVLDGEPPPPAPLTLLLALPRPKALRRVLQCVAAMGLKRVVLLQSWKVEKSYWASPALAEEAIRRELLLGLEQGGDTCLPRVEQRRRFKPFVEDELPALAAGTRRLLAHPRAAASCPHAVAEPITLAVGPEGGFIDYEVERLAELGFEPVTIGPRPLRVEHAVPALLGRLLA
jgi:RsmE family RNA methyltransferase